MSATEAAVYLGVVLLGFALSALFSGLETGLYTLNPIRLRLRCARGHAPALRVRRELRDPTRILTVLLIGTNAANYLGSFGLAEFLLGLGLGGWTLVVVEAVIITPLLFVFAETLPKELFRTHTNHWTYWLSPVLVLSRRILTFTALLPVVQLATGLVRRLCGRPNGEQVNARQRIGQLIKEGVGAGVLSVSQTTVVDRALAMRDRRIGALVIPWARAGTLPVDAGRGAREAVMRRWSFTRLPVVDGEGLVVGILSCVDAALDPGTPTRDLMQAPLTFAPATALLDALTRMREERQRMAIVVAPQTGRPVGVVTLKDLVEPITGELGAW